MEKLFHIKLQSKYDFCEISGQGFHAFFFGWGGDRVRGREWTKKDNMRTWRNLGIKALMGRSDNPVISESSNCGTSSQICINTDIRVFNCRNCIFSFTYLSQEKSY